MNKELVTIALGVALYVLLAPQVRKMGLAV
jgi:hypothetical protein